MNDQVTIAILAVAGFALFFAGCEPRPVVGVRVSAADAGGLENLGRALVSCAAQRLRCFNFGARLSFDLIRQQGSGSHGNGAPIP